MKNIISKLILSLSLMLVLGTLSAQKYGYINSTELLAAMPEVSVADSDLEAYQKQLISVGENMVKDFEKKYSALIAQADSGELSQIEIQQKENELRVEQEEIGTYEQEVQQKIFLKREELYKPILEKVRTALDTHAQENGYTMIFDSSNGGLLHATESDDLMDVMKQKLGI